MEDLMEACKWKKTKLMEFNGNVKWLKLHLYEWL